MDQNVHELTTSALAPMDPLDGLDRADLSRWFNPFLGRFAAEARRCAGEVTVARDGRTILGLLVTDPVERVASAFSRSRELVEGWVKTWGRFGVFSDYRFDPSDEVYDILALEFGSEEFPRRFLHPVRAATSHDLPEIRNVMREVYGVVNERWFDGLPTETEAGFVCELDGRVAGVGWVSLAGTTARLHSLTVRAPFRRMGFGTDLLRARLLWAQRMGAIRVLSEISQLNFASQALAMREGMRRVGEIYLHRPTAIEPGPATFELPRRTDTSRP